MRSPSLVQKGQLLAPRKYLKLLYKLTLRDVRARFSESVLGSVWLLLSPLVQLGVFTLVFGQLLPRPVGTDRPASYGCFLALGLWPWLMFSDAILHGSAAISKNANMVKKIAFPRTALVHAAVTGAFLIHGSGFLAVLAVLTLTGQPISASGLISAMAYLVCLYGIALGAAALFGGLQTAIRDIDHALPSGLTLLYFLTPILYPSEIMPAQFKAWLALNPIAPLISGVRDSFLNHGGIQTEFVVYPLVAAGFMLVIGHAVFLRLAPHFDDYL
jgi:ABC-type polysaccharide/polyol phosphate export permease